MKPRLLDLFCKAGGASMGYHLAGFDVTGVDIEPQPRYPFEFIQGDALEFLAAHGHEFDAVAGSPPCHDHTRLVTVTGANGTGWLLAATRAGMQATGLPYVIENVPGAKMRNPVVLCGSEFGLGATTQHHGQLWLKRHRLFESNVLLMGAGGCHCTVQSRRGRHIPVYGHGPGGNRSKLRGPGMAQAAREAMGIDWMTRDELDQAIPPAMTRFIGEQLITQLPMTSPSSRLETNPT